MAIKFNGTTYESIPKMYPALNTAIKLSTLQHRIGRNRRTGMNDQTSIQTALDVSQKGITKPQCDTCKKHKPRSEYATNKTYRNGLKNTCMPCEKKAQEKVKTAPNWNALLGAKKMGVLPKAAV